MLKIILANKAARKSLVFALAFAIAAISMSGSLLKVSDNALAVYASGGTFLLEESAPDPDIGTIVDLWSQLDGGEEFAAAVRSSDDAEYAGSFMTFAEGDKLIQTTAGFAYSSKIPLSAELQEYTYNCCVERNLEYELVLALMWRESRFQTQVVNYNSNGTYDSGIMQINDINKEWLLADHGIENLMDPYQNIKAGTVMLERFMSKYELNQALMAYQYGETGMQKKLSQGISTNTLITQALEKRDYFRELIQNA